MRKGWMKRRQKQIKRKKADLELKWMLATIDKENPFTLKSMRKRFNRLFCCSRGYHHIRPGHFHATETNYHKGVTTKKTIVNIRCFQCVSCQALLFFSVRDKRRYLKYRGKEFPWPEIKKHLPITTSWCLTLNSTAKRYGVRWTRQ